MKSLRLFIIMALLVGFGCTTLASKGNTTLERKTEAIHKASAYTYDGEFDPGEFADWDVSAYSVDKDGFFFFALINPDKDSDVFEIVVVVKNDKTLVYSYMRGGEQHLFAFDWKKNHYEQVLPKILPKPLDKSMGI